ncbi:PLP-dependent aminotransferase family protein [Brevibacillus reuszeri]|uniref:MocR-like pyridoxine biosynthesis transcription factor PdxR n=1 Tax=Brevibacillus reuszeri TaxID=54915 RepID=UPI003D19E224
MLQLTPKLDEGAKEALYLQLYRYIQGEMIAGRIPADARLPSIRRLAETLGVSRTPVALAYDQLLAEGYVISKPRSGLYAAELETGNRAQTLEQTYATPSPPRAYHASHTESVPYDFGYGSIDVHHFPWTKWRRLVNQCLLPENNRMLLYGDWQGEAELRAHIAQYLHQTRGVRCTPDQIVIGAGTYHSLDLLFQLMKKDVSTLALEAAVNDGVKSLVQQYPFACHPLGLENDGISIQDVVNSAADAVYVTPSHQFPFGMTLSIGKRMKLLKWAAERRAYIIENDYDGDFRYGTRPIPSLQSLDESGRVIYLGTFSRALGPAFRLSYLVLPPSLLDRFWKKQHSYDQLSSPILQKALLLFMQSGDFERHMRKMRTLYHRKHDVLLEALTKHFPKSAKVIGAGSGLHVLLQPGNGMDEVELVQAAEQVGVKVYPTSVYALSPEWSMPATVLLGFGGLAEEEIRAGIGLLAKTFGRE